MRGGRSRRRRRPAALLAGLPLAAAFLVLLGAVGCGGREDAGRGASASGEVEGTGLLAGKNLLFVTVDTLRADRLGSYGDERAATPHLDRLAAEGVRFADVYTSTPLTLPAHTVMFTGRYPFTTGVRINGIHYVDAAERTLAERFQDAGYDTGAVVAAYVMVSKFGLDQGFDLYEDSLTMDNVYRFYAEIPADEVVDRFTRWLDGRGGGGGATPPAPFFAWLHLYDAHQPYAPPAPFDQRFAADPYRGEIAFVDQQVGRLLGLLAERGLADDTAVVVTSDHGEAFGEHGEWGHGLLAYDETMRVPLIVRAPASVPGVAAGRVVAERVSLYDVTPTVVDLFGLDRTADLPGRSLVPALLRGAGGEGEGGGAGRIEPAEVYFEALAGREKGWAPITGVVGGPGHPDLKFIDVPRPELYDLAADPRERRNLLSADAPAVDGADGRAAAAGGEAATAAAEAAPQEGGGPGAASAEDRLRQARRAARDLERRLADLLAAGERETTREMTSEDRQALTALGYLGGGGGALRPGETGLDPKIAIEVENRVREVRTLAGEGRVTEAEASLARLRSRYPDVEVPDLYELDFHVASARGDVASAVSALERGVARYPDYQSLRLRLATYLEEIGRYDQAQAQAAKLLEIDPRNSQARSLMGLVAEGRGDVEGARRQFEEALQLEPRSVPLRAKVAELSLRGGDAQRARGLYDQLLAEGALDDQPNQLARSALLDAALGNLDRAVATLRRVVAQEDAGAHHLSLAMLLLQQGDRGEAARELERALAAEAQPLEPAQQAMARQALQQLRAAG